VNVVSPNDPAFGGEHPKDGVAFEAKKCSLFRLRVKLLTVRLRK
jgi:hypothetical protein